MCRHPVEDNAQTVLVAVVDEFHKIVRRAETRSRSKVTYALITPRAVEREFRDRHHLDMRVAHLLCVRNEFLGAFHIVEELFLVVFVLPRIEVYFVNIHR